MAFALASEYQEEQLAEMQALQPNSHDAAQAIFNSTLTFILFTVLICGSVVQPLLDWLKVPRGVVSK